MKQDRKIRVAVVTPALLIGGAERWIVNLLQSTDPERIQWQAIVLLDPEKRHAAIVCEIERTCPVLLDASAINHLSKTCDIIILWGIPDSQKLFPIDRKCKVVLVSHGSGDWTAKVFRDCHYADGLVAVSQAARAPVPLSAQNRVRIIYNGVDLRRVQPKRHRDEVRQEWGVQPGQKVLGYLGRMSPEKNPLAVPMTLEYLPWHWIGVMVGNGSHSQGVRLYSQSTVNRVLFPGETHDVGSTINAFDWLILPSYEEGCSFSLIEAWLARVPVIASLVGMVQERPDLVRLIPAGASGAEIARRLVADEMDGSGTTQRIDAAFQYAQTHLMLSCFGARWTTYLAEIAVHLE